MRGEARMPGPSFRLSTLDGELFALAISTQAPPMFTLTDSASRPEISALDRAGPLEMQTHQKCPPRRLSPLEWIITRHRRAPASYLESALTRLLALKSFRFRTYVKHPGGYPPSPALFRLTCFLFLLPFAFYLLHFAFCIFPSASLPQPRRRSFTRCRKRIGVPMNSNLSRSWFSRKRSYLKCSRLAERTAILRYEH